MTPVACAEFRQLAPDRKAAALVASSGSAPPRQLAWNRLPGERRPFLRSVLSSGNIRTARLIAHRSTPCNDPPSVSSSRVVHSSFPRTFCPSVILSLTLLLQPIVAFRSCLQNMLPNCRRVSILLWMLLNKPQTLSCATTSLRNWRSSENVMRRRSRQQTEVPKICSDG